MNNWEYRTVTTPEPLTAAELDEYGLRSWELISLLTVGTHLHYVFKRPCY